MSQALTSAGLPMGNDFLTAGLMSECAYGSRCAPTHEHFLAALELLATGL